MIKVGCCGPGMALEQYRKQFDVLEVQQTFYQPPQLKTLERWRQRSPDHFEFTIKAWQLITHKASSPTYKRIKHPLTEQEKSDAGSFRFTPIVKRALAVTLDCAKALNAKSILFQCPKSFLPSEENQLSLRRFFSEMNRPSGIDFYIEPRGDWSPEIVKKLCTELQLFHAVDPLVTSTVTPEKMYYRLHGVGGYRYHYDDIDLKKIAKLAAQTAGGYVFFNNTSMTTDARHFAEIVSQQTAADVHT